MMFEMCEEKEKSSGTGSSPPANQGLHRKIRKEPK